MKTKTIYVCDVCGKESAESMDIIKCECAHLNIDIRTLNRWRDLRKVAAEAGKTYSIRHNEETDAAFDKAVVELVKFEKKHSLIDKKIPEIKLF